MLVVDFDLRCTSVESDRAVEVSCHRLQPAVNKCLESLSSVASEGVGRRVDDIDDDFIRWLLRWPGKRDVLPKEEKRLV